MPSYDTFVSLASLTLTLIKSSPALEKIRSTEGTRQLETLRRRREKYSDSG